MTGYRSRRSREWGRPRTKVTIDHARRHISGTVVARAVNEGCPHSLVWTDEDGERHVVRCELQAGHDGMHAGGGRRWS